jgi:hypothetical protein
MSNDLNPRLDGVFPIHILAFNDSGEGDEIYDDASLGELTDVADGYVEIGMTYGEERVYVRFRKSDLDRAVKEKEATRQEKEA